MLEPQTLQSRPSIERLAQQKGNDHATFRIPVFHLKNIDFAHIYLSTSKQLVPTRSPTILRECG
jgi:hypothetical protein